MDRSWTRRGKRSRLVRTATLITLAAALLSCAGSRPAVNPGSGGGDGPQRPAGFHLAELSVEQRRELDRRAAKVLPPRAYAALAQLGLAPLPASSGGGRRAAVALPYFQADATVAYAPGDGGWIAHSADVTINPGPPQPSMDMAPPGGGFPGDFSYVIYRVDDVVPQPLSLSLQTSLSPGPVGVAAYNWAYGALGRWEPLFYGPPDNGVVQVSLETIGANYTNGGGDMAFVVFCLAPVTVSVNSFLVSDQSSNEAPTARLAADKGGGQAPLSVNFDASNSSDPDGLIVKYRFDPLGTGEWVDNGSDPLFSYVYEFPGAHDIGLEVTDAGGLKDTEVKTVIVRFGPYDEQEDNDALVEANMLPLFPIGKFTGNCGPAGPHADDQDWFTFNAQPGETVTFLVEHSDLEGSNEFSAQLFDSDMSPLPGSFGYPASPFSYKFEGWEAAPYYVRVFNPAGHSDYILSASKQAANQYDEFEDNDSPASANRLDNLTDEGEMVAYKGSLGSDPPGYPGYDGDSEDYFYFGASAGMELDLAITFTNGTAPELGVTLLDGNLEVLANELSTDGKLELYYLFGNEVHPLFLHVVPTSGFTDYTMDGSLVVQNPGFDEQENNDSYAQANLLPALPFGNFTANIGLGGSYDGDFNDYFMFLADTGDKYTLTVTPDNPGVFWDVELRDSDGKIIGGVSIEPGTAVITANILIRTGDSSPFFLRLTENAGNSSDYTIGAGIASFSEVEDNDNFGQANQLPAGSFQFFSGNIGSGGADYDGDALDVFTFDADEGDTPSFTVHYDDWTGVPAGQIKDANGDVLGGWSLGDNRTVVVTTDFPLGPGDVAPYYLEISPSEVDHYTDYWISSGGPT